jgi:cytochrome c oxidase cbb3-type subunit 3
MTRIKNYILSFLQSSSIKRTVLLMMTILFPIMANAQEFLKETSENELVLIIVMFMVFVVLIIVLLVIFYVLVILKSIVGNEKKAEAEAEGIEYAPEPSLWQKLAGTDVPIKEESSILLDHNYDGIRELDNHLPPWWKYLFYMTIVFAVVYVFLYHVSDTLPLQAEEYQMELAAAEKQSGTRIAEAGISIDETNVEFSEEASVLENGGKLYARTCAVCHAPDGGGGIGPNLVDEYWLHGGSIQEIFKTIKYGVPDKGMISWQSQMSASDMSDVSSFLFSLKGTTPASSKDPQGEKE